MMTCIIFILFPVHMGCFSYKIDISGSCCKDCIFNYFPKNYTVHFIISFQRLSDITGIVTLIVHK